MTPEARQTLAETITPVGDDTGDVERGSWEGRPKRLSFVADVHAIATWATSHNYGRTVYEVAEWRPGEVWLKMSSWPRAQEARRALEEAGYVVRGRDDSPCSLLVRKPS